MVGLVEELELVLVAGMGVRMQLLGLYIVHAFDLGNISSGSDTQDTVVVFLLLCTSKVVFVTVLQHCNHPLVVPDHSMILYYIIK